MERVERVRPLLRVEQVEHIRPLRQMEHLRKKIIASYRDCIYT